MQHMQHASSGRSVPTHLLSMPITRCVHADFDAQALLDEQGKGKPLPAVVELIITGSMLRATLLPDR